MFQFTTTNVINSIKGLLTFHDATDTKGATLNIKGVNNFCKDNVLHIYKSSYVVGVPPTATVALGDLNIAGSTLKNGDKLRLNMYITLTQGSNLSLYANDSYYKGKPFWVDFVWAGNDTAKNLVNIIKKYMLNVHGEKMVEVSYETNNLIIKGVSEYQRFEKVDIEKIDTEAYHGLGDSTVIKSATITQGVEGFGTYEYILHNLRIPTAARTGFMAVNQEESPIPGANYNQYTIHYCVNRGTLGSNAVGDQVTSHTTHVFYVLDSLSTEFETQLKKIAPENKLEGATPKDKEALNTPA